MILVFLVILGSDYLTNSDWVAGVNTMRNYRLPHFTGMVTMSLILVFLLTGCSKDPNERFIQGLWYFKDPHLANIPAESAQETQWLFENGLFEAVSCCFSKFNLQGNYRILESEEDILTLELYNLAGDQQGVSVSRQDTTQFRIVLDRENDALTISRAGPFNRLTPKPEDDE
jgi:hypothetical protein